MAFYVYMHKDCEEQAIKEHVSDIVLKFKERIEHEQKNLFPHVNTYKPYEVKPIDQNRHGIIARVRGIGNDNVIEFIKVLTWGREYGSFTEGRKKGDYLPKATDEELVKYIEERNRKEPLKPKIKPNENESSWLYGAFAHQTKTSERLVYETHEWKETVTTNNEVANYLNDICESIFKFLDDSSHEGYGELTISKKPAWKFAVFKSAKNLFLLLPITEKANEINKIEEWRHKLENNEEQDIIRCCRRSYPSEMLYDYDIWIEIEKEKIANMALSSEESDLLKDAREGENFPLFINGRAGSGKSTILQYIFADLLYHKDINDDSLTPIYLTANGELLRTAKEITLKILKAECKKNEKEVPDDTKFQDAFYEFQRYLLKLLPKEDADKFQPKNRINYVRFREWYVESKFNQNKDMLDCSSEISWHIIRSYIKGMALDGLMNADDYKNFYKDLPIAEKTVTYEMFEKVVDRVWTSYSDDCKQKSLWDDQDIALYVLENDLVKSKHPAVLCDESQDFTRIELEILFRLNLFSDKNIAKQDLRRVPFIFAGDQFQTLNPTGFRWDAINANFVDKFIKNFNDVSALKINYNELTYNYRSTPRIVKFSNGIQCFRSVLFKIPNLKPQKPWSPMQNECYVNYFKSSNIGLWKKIEEIGTYYIIVPCNEGEELDFVKKDDILNKYVKIENEVPRMVLSSARAKGREFPAVMLYGFGKEAPDNLKELQNNFGIQDNLKKITKQLPYEYFINKLYVAASRPKQRLIIVDNEQDLKRLWYFALDKNERETIINKANGEKDKIWNNEDIEGMFEGKPEDLTAEKAVDTKELALESEKNAETNKDSFSYKQAANLWEDAGEKMKAESCLACAYEIDKKFLEAGDKFYNLNNYEKALLCYWKAGESGWSKIASYTNNEFVRTLEFRLAQNYKNTNETIRLLNAVCERTKNIEFAKKLSSDNEYLVSLENILNKILENSIKELKEDNFKIIIDLLDELKKKSIDIPKETIEKINAQLYPMKLERLKPEEQIKEFEKHDNLNIPVKYLNLIAKAYFQKKDLEKSFNNAWNARNEDILLDIYKETKKNDLKFALVKILARSETLIKLSRDPQKRWSDFLSENFLKEFLEGKRNFQGKVAMKELGSAIERAGHHIDSIRFYKHLEENGFPDEKEFAVKRRYVCLKRRLSNKPNPKDSDDLKDLEQKLDNAIIGSLPDYPELEELVKPTIKWREENASNDLQIKQEAEKVEIPDDIKMELGNISLDFSREKKRINFTNQEKEMAYIKFKESLDVVDDEKWLEKEVTASFSENKDSINLNFVKLGVDVILKI